MNTFNEISNGITNEPSYQLNYIESLWEGVYKDRNPMIVTGVFAFLLHEVVYFGRFLPFLICDMIPQFKKYKLQPKKANSSNDYWKCTWKVLRSHFLFEGPLIFFFHPMATFLGMRVSAPFPSWQYMCIEIIIFFFFEDFYHYITHRAMHWPPFYKKIHKVHHEYSAPFGIAAEYAHPIEIMILGFGTVCGPLMYHGVVHYMLKLDEAWDLHLATMLLWIVFRLFQAIESHSGYDFPWSLHNWVPFWAGSSHHDYHHKTSVGNYASSFRLWDHVFGTNVKYLAYLKRQKEEQLKLKKTVKFQQ